MLIISFTNTPEEDTEQSKQFILGMILVVPPEEDTEQSEQFILCMILPPSLTSDHDI